MICTFTARCIWAASYSTNPSFPHSVLFKDLVNLAYEYIGCNFKYPLSPTSTKRTHILPNVDFDSVAEEATSWYFWDQRRLRAKMVWLGTARQLISAFSDELIQLGCEKPPPADYRWSWAEAIVMSLNNETGTRLRAMTKPTFCSFNATIEAQDWTLDFDNVFDLSTNEIVADSEPTSWESLVNSIYNHTYKDDKPSRDSLISSLRELITCDTLDMDDNHPIHFR